MESGFGSSLGSEAPLVGLDLELSLEPSDGSLVPGRSRSAGRSFGLVGSADRGFVRFIRKKIAACQGWGRSDASRIERRHSRRNRDFEALCWCIALKGC